MKEFCTRSEFARRQNVTRETVSRWVRKGYAKLAADGRRVDIKATEKLLASRPPKFRGGSTKGPRAADASTDRTLSEWTVRKERALAELRELDLQIRRGELIRVSDFNGFWGSLVVANRNMYLGTPRQIAFEVPTLTATDRSTIERICRQNLEDGALGRGYFSDVGKIDEGKNEPEK
jgi:hypothetical protein